MCDNYFCVSVRMHAARRPGVMEVMHNLDYCDILVIGEELNPDTEGLEIYHSALLGKHLDATNSTSGISIYGRHSRHVDRDWICCLQLLPVKQHSVDLTSTYLRVYKGWTPWPTMSRS